MEAKLSVWSLQSDGFVTIGNAASYGCVAFWCAEFGFVCSRGLTLSISLPLSACLCVTQSIVHDLNIQ